MCRRTSLQQTVQFKPGDTVHGVEQLDWMQAWFFGQPPR